MAHSTLPSRYSVSFFSCFAFFQRAWAARVFEESLGTLVDLRDQLARFLPAGLGGETGGLLALLCGLILHAGLTTTSPECHGCWILRRHACSFTTTL